MSKQKSSTVFSPQTAPTREILTGSLRRRRVSKRNPSAWPLIVLAAVILLPGCKNSKTAPQTPTANLPSYGKPSRIIGIGRIEPELKILHLAGEVPGLIVKINARPGDPVLKGKAIIELNRAVEEAKLEQIEIKTRTQKTDIESAKAALAATNIRAENARVAYERNKTLLEQNAQAEYIYDNAKADYEALLEDIKRFEAGVKSAESLLDQDRAELKLARAELDRRFIRAPADGRVLSLDIVVGSSVVPETVCGAFAPDGPLSAWCEVDEMFAAEVMEGQKATVRKQGTTEEIGRGEVVFAGPYLRRKSLFSDEIGDLEDRRVREIRIRLDPGFPILIGSRVECVISTGE